MLSVMRKTWGWLEGPARGVAGAAMSAPLEGVAKDAFRAAEARGRHSPLKVHGVNNRKKVSG